MTCFAQRALARCSMQSGICCSFLGWLSLLNQLKQKKYTWCRATMHWSHKLRSVMVFERSSRKICVKTFIWAFGEVYIVWQSDSLTVWQSDSLTLKKMWKERKPHNIFNLTRWPIQKFGMNCFVLAGLLVRFGNSCHTCSQSEPSMEN